jgi:hypothetical protein
MRAIVALLALSLVTVAVGAAQPLTPLVVDWQQYFTVEQRPGAATIWNTSGWNAQRIQLLIEALDGAGQPTTQQVVWLGSDLPAGTHADVDMPVSPAPYRVRVFAFNLDLSAGPR